MSIPSRRYFFDRIAGIYRTAMDIESESDSYSDAFNDAQYIQNLANDLDAGLASFFNELYSFLKEIEKGNINKEKLDLLLYALER